MVEVDRSCVVQVSTSPVHISSRQQRTPPSTDVRCGSVDQPWTLRAPTGQHIRVHLLDFTSSQATLRDDDDDGGGCTEYGYVTDETPSSAAVSRARRQTAICGDRRRDKVVVESKLNVVHVVFNGPASNVSNVNFLLRFYGE